MLAWEPSAAQNTSPPAVYPHLNDFTGKLNFRSAPYADVKYLNQTIR